MIKELFSRPFLLNLKQEVARDDLSQGAAALAYYLTLALFPALILLLTIVPFLPVEGVDQAIMKWVGQTLPQQAYTMVERVVQDVVSDRRGGLLSFGLVGSVWVTSIGMYAVMRQLNSTYQVTEDRSFLRAWSTALFLSVMFGCLVLGAFSLIVIGGTAEDWLSSRFGFGAFIINAFSVVRWLIIIVAMLLGLSLIYHVGPNVKQSFRFLTPGSGFAVFVLIISSLVFSFYTRNFALYDAVYGSIGAMIVLMLWLYIAGFVILLGSEINALVEQRNPQGKSKGERATGET